MSIRVQKLGEQILRVLVARIVNGELTPGSKAPSEMEIGSEFGVSKSVARDVVAALVSKRLVAVSQGRRPEVLPTSEWDVFDPLILELQEDQEAIDEVVAAMQDARTIFEPEIAARAALRIDDDQLEQLREAKERMRELGDQPERLDADVDFHVVLARASGNRILEHIVESMRKLMRVSVQQRAERYLAREPGAAARDSDYHEQIYAAVAARDPDAARAAMQAHMQMATQEWAPAQGAGEAPGA